MSTEVVVTITNGRPITTSKDVAEKFGKRHDNVLRAIEDLDCSEKFRRLNFEESSYVNTQGKTQPAYDMTRDGFTFLAMGFTGKAAAHWKEKYIQAFNAMEAELLRQQPKIPQTYKEALIAHLAAIEQLEEANKKIEILEPEAGAFKRVVAHKRLSVSEYARKLAGVNTKETKKSLLFLGYFYKVHKHYRVYSAYRDTLFEEKIDEIYGKCEIYPTAEGKLLMDKLYRDGKLTMKVKR